MMMEEEVGLPIWRESRLVFGNSERGRAVFLDPTDPFSSNLEAFEMVARSRNPECSTVEAFRQMQATQIRPWEAHEREEISRLVLELYDQLKRFNWLPLPGVIYLFKTSGIEETAVETSPVAYCRGKNNVFISQANFTDPIAKTGLKRLVLHELWHIVSRNCTEPFVDRVYAIFGFNRINSGPMAYPVELAQLRFSNPDALYVSHYINVTVADDEAPGTAATLSVAPLLYLQPYNVMEGSPFDSIGVAWGVLAVGSDGRAVWTQVENDEDDGENEDENSSHNDEDEEAGEATSRRATMLLPHGSLPEEFWRKISRNTEYILHVEEICAENFVLCVTQDKCDDSTKPTAMFEVLQRGDDGCAKK